MNYPYLDGDNELDRASRLRRFINLARDEEFDRFLKTPFDDAQRRVGEYLNYEFFFHQSELLANGLTRRVLSLLATPFGNEALWGYRGSDRRANPAWTAALSLATEHGKGPAKEEGAEFMIACVAPRAEEHAGLLSGACCALIDGRAIAGDAGKRALAEGLCRLEEKGEVASATACWHFGIACSTAPAFLREMARLGAPFPASAALGGLMSLARPPCAGSGPRGETLRQQGLERYLEELIELRVLTTDTVKRGLALRERDLPHDAKALLERMWIEAECERGQMPSHEKPSAPRL